jgi:fucose permease
MNDRIANEANYEKILEKEQDVSEDKKLEVSANRDLDRSGHTNITLNHPNDNITSADNQLEENLVDLLLEKVSLNVEHFKIILLLILYITGEGFVMIGISLIVPVVSIPWKLTEFQKGLIGGSVFLGFTFGALVAGGISDKKGRKMAFLIGNVFSLIGGLLGLGANEINVFVFSNFLLGLGIGISIPSIFSLCSEVTNSNIRSVIIGTVWIFFVCGEILGCWIALRNEMYRYKTGNWEKLLYFRCITVSIK